MKYSKGLLASLAMITIGGSFVGYDAQAETIAEYTFTGNSPASSDSSAATVAGAAAFGSWDGFSSPDYGISSEVAYARSSVTSDQLSNLSGNGAIDHNDYLGFTITGVDFDIAAISFQHSMTDTDNGNTYQAHLFTSATGFSEGDVLLSTSLAGTGGAVSDTPTLVTTGIAALQGIVGDLEVRIYFTDAQTIPGFIHTLDNIIVSGVPEPGSLALFGLGGVCVLWRRRRD